MGKSYYRWGLNSDVPLFLQLISPSGGGATGLSPTVAIRRHRTTAGVLLDGNYYDGAGGFTATPTFLSMTEFDAVNNPGLYLRQFDQSVVGVDTIYLCYFQHLVSPIGFAIEEHIFSNEIFIPSSSPAPPPVIGETVMGKLKDMEDPTKPVALANADAVWDEPLNDHLLPGSTGEALKQIVLGQIGARQIDIQVEDTGPAPIQGAQIDLYDITNTIFLGVRLYSDINGKTSLAIDDGNYNFRVFASGYSFTVPIPIAVTADILEPTPFTIVGTPGFVITPPSAPDLCVIYGTLRDAGGKAIQGACIQAFATTPQVVAGTQKGNPIASVTTDVTGFFELELVRNTEVNIVVEKAGLDIIRTVPDAASQDLTTWT
jgi:hypothetical protein